MKEYTKEEIIKTYTIISDFEKSEECSKIRLALVQVRNFLANMYCNKVNEEQE